MIENLWNLKIQILPVVISLIICELPGITRWFKRLPYIPIYFTVFPLNILNSDLSIYLGEDHLYGDGSNLPKEKIKLLRKHIKNLATVSMALSVTAPPFFGGFFSAFFLPVDSFWGFCIIFIVYKLIGVTEAALDFRKCEIANLKTMTLFLTIYFVYFLLFLHVFGATYKWANPFILKGDWIGLLKDSHTLIFNFIINLIIMGPLARYFSSIITDRKLRDQVNE